MVDISVVIPLFNEEESLPELHTWIQRVMNENTFTYEVVFVDDGSTDSSWSVVEELAAKDSCVKGIRFQRNYGKSAALNEGFQIVDGEVVITMDADLQDSPEEIPELRRMIVEDGLDLVSGWKQKRFDPLSKTIPTKFFNAATRKMSGIQLNDFNCGLKAYKYQVVKSIEVYGEMHRYIPVIAKWAGFSKIGEKVVQHQERKYGVTKFGIERFINGFLDLLSITFVSRFEKKPMHFFGAFGVLMFLLGGTMVTWLIGAKLYAIYFAHNNTYREITEQPLFYIALISLVIGTQLFLTGFVAELVSRKASDRNEYLVSTRVNHK
ncbi:MAG: glycosyltransferase involved in cell wall biosynthesis [Flavobacteriales bacterium]|jgi:glycosyltransferase involved in cell wall biosynthesis